MIRTFSVAASVAAIWAATYAIADAETILPKNTTGNVGFQVTSGGWLDTNENHADASYRAFKKILKKEPTTFDYYYQLKVAPQYRGAQNWCQTGINVGSFLRAFFGVSSASLALMKVTLNWEYDAGQNYNFISVQSPILMMGSGSAAGGINPGQGCYFDATQPFETPLLRYSGGGDSQDNFGFKFAVSGGKAVSINAVKTVFGLFNTFNTALNFATVRAGNTALVQQYSQSFEAALAQAGTFQNATSVDYVMKLTDRANNRIQISVPDLFGDRAPSGNIIVYVRRSASIVLDTADKTITPARLLESSRIALRHCGLEAVTKGACPAGKSFRFALIEMVKQNNDEKIPLNIYDLSSPEGRKKKFNQCELVRTSLRENFRLSVADEMFMRWALVSQSGLLDELNDQKKLSELAQANGVSPAALVNSCYNAGDEGVLSALTSAVGFQRRRS